MKGFLHKLRTGWVLRYNRNEFTTTELPLLPKSCVGLTSENNVTEVDFEIVDEFTNPELYRDVAWGEGKRFAKII